MLAVALYFVLCRAQPEQHPVKVLGIELDETPGQATPGVKPTSNPAFESHFVQPENDVQPEGAVYMKNGIWLDEDGNEVKG